MIPISNVLILLILFPIEAYLVVTVFISDVAHGDNTRERIVGRDSLKGVCQDVKGLSYVRGCPGYQDLLLLRIYGRKETCRCNVPVSAG